MTVTPISTGKGRVLIVGATGFIGQFIAEASLAAGRTTYVLVRPGPGGPSKAKNVKALQDKGAIILHVNISLNPPQTHSRTSLFWLLFISIYICLQGLIKDKQFVEKILKEREIDIVISAVGGENILDQLNLIDAIKTVGTVKVCILIF